MAKAERKIGRSCIKGCFLDELNPLDGITPTPVLPDCGSLCEIKFTDILDERAIAIFSDPSELLQWYKILY